MAIGHAPVLAFVLLSSVLCLPSSAVQAQTALERAACRPDVFRLCTADQITLAVIGDRSGIYACFKQHRRELSRVCDRVLKAHGY